MYSAAKMGPKALASEPGKLSEITNKPLKTDVDLSMDNKMVPATNAKSMTESIKEIAEQAFKLDLDDDFKGSGTTKTVNHPITLAKQENPPKKRTKTNWIMFDCDNTLVLSETLAFTASFVLVNEVLESKGKEKRYDQDEILLDFMGCSFKKMCEKMAIMYDFEWTQADRDHFDTREEEEVIKIFEKKLTIMPGIFNILCEIVHRRSHNIAVVSSSSTKRIMSCLKKTNLDIFFLPQYIFSAASSLETKATKPNPEIYLHAMKTLGIKPANCICIEDSRVGVMAAVGAGIRCIGFLGSYNGRDKQDQLKIDMEIDGVAAIMWLWKDFWDVLEEVESKTAT